MKEEKKCKGTGPALASGAGCGIMVKVQLFGKANRKYGLGMYPCKCYQNWLVDSPEGKEKIEKSTLKATGSHEKAVMKKCRKRTKDQKEAMKGKQDYEKELEKIFNKYIRLRDKDQPCISCDAEAGTYTMSAGHYYPAGHYKNIRFDEDNVHGQCWFFCNKNRHGNLSEYQPRLIIKIGEQAFKDLVQRRLVPAHFTIPELKDMIEHYKLKVKRLEK